MITLEEALDALSLIESRAVLEVLARGNPQIVAKAIEQAARLPVIRGEVISSDALDDNAAVAVIP